MKVDFHADDYGYSINTSKDILDCLKNKKLDSISIISNMESFDESMNMLYLEIPKLSYLPLMSIHLNFVEGIFDDYFFPLSWKKLFIFSYIPNSKLKKKIKKEIKKQIENTNKAINKCIEIAQINNIKCEQKKIRIDSHQHTHLIPIVWKALIEVIEENNYDIEYIRNPKEPLKPFLKSVSLWHTYNIINIIKNRILMIYSKRVDKYCRKNKIDLMYMWGLIMSGKMDTYRIKHIYPSLCELSKIKNRNLEILFHPGLALNSEVSKYINIRYFNEFNGTVNRKIEKNALIEIDKMQ